MAKHDQRILKFLTQNADRAPTITDMMTRLNISISDITTSLNSLMAQGLVSKRTNGQGIECWFPTNGSVPAAVVEPVQEARVLSESRFASPLASPAPPEPSPLPPLHNPIPASSLTGSQAFPAPPPSKSPALESAVFTASPAHMAVASANGSAPAAGGATGPIEHLPGVTPPMPAYALAQPKSGPGWFAFLLGLLATGAAAVFAGKHLLAKDIARSSKGFVEKSEMEAAVSSWTDFENSTKGQVKDLEGQVKDLKDQLAAMKAQNDSLQAVAAKQAEEAKKSAVASRKVPARKRR